MDGTLDFIPTHAACDALRALDAVRAARAVGLLVADSGAGRTALLREYVRRQGPAAPGRVPALLYRAEVVNTPRSVVQALLRPLGIAWSGSTRTGFVILRAALRGAGTAIVLVDDAGRLARHSLDMLRALHEASGVALVLAGSKPLHRFLHACRPELAHRAASLHELQPLEMEDALAVVNAAGIGRKQRAYWERVALARTLLRESGGNFHRLLQLWTAARARAREGHRAVSAATVARTAAAFPGLASRAG